MLQKAPLKTIESWKTDSYLTKLIHNTKQYAKLLLSVGRQGRNIAKRRPLSPVECAEMIQRLMKEENESKVEISKMLGLGRPENKSNIYQKRDTTQVNLFLKLLQVSDKSRYFAGWGYEEYPKIPFSTMALMISLKPEEQDKIIQSAYNENKKILITKNDVHKITRWKRDNPDLPIEECIENVLKLKPVVDTTHMIICEISDVLKNFIQSNKDYKQKLINMLDRDIEGSFYAVDATDLLITISMDDTAYKTFHDKQYKKDISFTQFLNEFLEDKIG